MDQEKMAPWAYRKSDLPDNWPTGADGKPEPGALLAAAQSELGGGADVLISLLDGCGIPALKAGSQGRVILGFAGLGVDIYVPQSRFEEARSILSAPVEMPGSDPDSSQPNEFK